MTTHLMPSILDREIDSEKNDAFGHRHFSAALGSLIEAAAHQPPFSIGLLGKWGSGKSSIKAMYLKALADSRSNGTVYPVTFNAWRYGGEDLKRALLRHVFLAAGGSKTALDDALFNQLEETVKRPLSWKEIGREFYECFLWPSAQLLLAAVCIAIVASIIAMPFDLTSPWTSAAVMGGIAALGWKLLEQLPELNRILLCRTASVVRVDAPRSTAEQFEDLLVNQIKAFKKGSALDEKGKKCERLVVFVDDLDRLSSEEMVTGLDAIRMFMEIPFDTTGVGIVFVISCDEDRVADALSRNKARNTEMPGAVFSRSDARCYLDRIFQFRLEVPELPKRDLRSFATERLRAEAPEIIHDLEEAGVPLENVIDRMIHVGVASPRNAVQILNSFAQCWWIAKKREHVGPGTIRPGGLQQGAVTAHPIALAALSAIRVDFPDFFQHLVKEPDLIERFTAVFIRNEPLEKQPEFTRNILTTYVDKDGELQSQHGRLKRFLSSLAGLRWPQTIMPLLLLSQDPITRRHGDKAVPMYEAFVSADSEGILRILGRDADTRPLDSSEVRLLKDMVEELERETPVRRDNAAACLAELADRLPESDAHHLLSPLARRLAHSQDLRCRLGVSKIKKVLPQAMLDDRRDVADRLVSDLLLIEGETDFRLPSGQKPSIDGAVEFTREACELALWVRDSDGLPSATDKKLLGWLEVRRVAVENKEDTLPFSDFEDWVTEYEASLLPSLKERYTALVAEQFQANAIPSSCVESTLSKCRVVFDLLWSEGQESQAILWQQLPEFVAVKNKEAVSFAWSEALKHPEGPSGDEFARFVTSLSGRLVKDAEDDENWEADWESGGDALCSLLKGGRTISGNVEEALGVLVTAWAKHEVCGAHACSLLDILVQFESEQSVKIIADWVQRLLTDLPSACVDWCGGHIESCWTNQQKLETVERLNQHIKRNNVPEEEAKRYERVMKSFPTTAIRSPPLVSHVTHLCSQIQARSANPNDYVKRLFPVVVALLEHCEGPPAGGMLQQLFSDTRGNAELFGWLHGQMIGHWPEATESTGAYNPTQLFEEAVTTAVSSPTAASTDLVLRSLHSMNDVGIGPSDATTKILGVACKLWPHHSDCAVEVFRETLGTPEPQFVAKMLDGLSINSSDDVQLLADAWGYIAQKSDRSRSVQIGIHVLRRQPVNMEGRADIGFALWIDCCSDSQPDVLHALLFNGELTDDQRKRVWLQIDQRMADLGKAYLSENIPDLLKLPESQETTRAVIDAQERVNQLFPTKEDRYDLGTILLAAFLSAPSRESQNRLVDWIKSLKMDSVLKELPKLGTLSAEDYEALKSAFPTSRYLKRAKVEENS